MVPSGKHRSIDAMTIVIAGPTASGKSALAIELAKKLDGAIISADSMQIYKGMDIGTAKMAPNEREVEHFGIDIVDPGTPYSAALFQSYARDRISDIEASGRVPVLCGGTGFYIRAAIDDYEFPKGEQVNNPVRARYQKLFKEAGAQALWEALNERDPESAKLIHPNNVKRVIRAFELLEEGESYASQAEKLKSIPQAVPAIMLLIDVDRDILNERINERVDKMRDEGLVDEVKGLLEHGFRDALTSAQAIGYKEIVAALDGQMTMDEAFESIKTATRRYAKRQRSWFRADSRYHGINGNDGDIPTMLDEAIKIIDTLQKTA